MTETVYLQWPGAKVTSQPYSRVNLARVFSCPSPDLCSSGLLRKFLKSTFPHVSLPWYRPVPYTSSLPRERRPFTRLHETPPCESNDNRVNKTTIFITTTYFRCSPRTKTFIYRNKTHTQNSCTVGRLVLNQGVKIKQVLPSETMTRESKRDQLWRSRRRKVLGVSWGLRGPESREGLVERPGIGVHREGTSYDIGVSFKLFPSPTPG